MRLEVNDLHVRYGRVHAVRGVSLTVDEGEVVAMLGANGAGKSSLLKALMGLEPAAEGSVTLDGADITHWTTSRRRASIRPRPTRCASASPRSAASVASRSWWSSMTCTLSARCALR